MHENNCIPRKNKCLTWSVGVWNRVAIPSQELYLTDGNSTQLPRNNVTLMQLLNTDDNGEYRFQQNDATAHTTGDDGNIMWTVFKAYNLNFADINWPARSPDLTASDFFLCGYLTAQIYATITRSVRQRKELVISAVSEIDAPLPERVMDNFARRLYECSLLGWPLNWFHFQKVKTVD